jgi:hypothetical protein
VHIVVVDDKKGRSATGFAAEGPLHSKVSWRMCCRDHSHGTSDGYIVIYTSPTPQLLFSGVMSSEYMSDEYGSTDSSHTKACHSHLCVRVHGAYCRWHWSYLKMNTALTVVLM